METNLEQELSSRAQGRLLACEMILFSRFGQREYALSKQVTKALMSGDRRQERLAHWFARPAWVLAAAAVLVAVWMSVEGRVSRGRGGEEKAIVRVEQVSGVRCQVSGGEKKPLNAGDEMREGIRVETGPGARVKLAYVNRQTTVDLWDNSKFEIRNSQLGYLGQGRLATVVAKQSGEAGFVVETPHAKVEVSGTRFGVRVESGQSPIADGGSPMARTWLDVEEGKVRATRLADGEAIEVEAGQFAVVGENAGDYALKIYTNGTKWMDGPMFVEDDFEHGLGKWTLNTMDATMPESQLLPANEASFLVSIREVKRGDSAPKAAVIDRTASLPGSHNLVFSLLHDSPDTGSFVYEFDYCVLSRKGGKYIFFRGARPLHYGTWHRIRTEFVEADRFVEQTTFADGNFVGKVLNMRRVEHLQIVAGQDSDTVMVANVIGRRLIAAGNANREPASRKLPGLRPAR